jgi:hypothetical protein
VPFKKIKRYEKIGMKIKEGESPEWRDFSQ